MLKQRDISHFGMMDWDFKSEDSRSFVHNFCWYPSRFIPIIPSHLIKSLSHPGDTVLDPYCGSGTTILESLKLGRNAIGVDINPVATFISKVKIDVAKKNNISLGIINSLLNELEIIDNIINKSKEQCLFEDTVKSPIDEIQQEEISNYDENSKWYHPLTLKMLAFIFKRLQKVDCVETSNLLKLFFISILMPSASHENKKPYTYYADNCQPKILVYNNATSYYINKLKKFISEYKRYTTPVSGNGIVITDDIMNLQQAIITHTPVDLVVTSPPYLGVTDYITGYRLVYLWDMFNTDIANLKMHEIGARWKRKKSTSTSEYITALEASLTNMANSVKRNGYICLVVGEAKKHREIVISELLKFASNKIGLDLQDSFSRNVSKNYFLHPKGGVPTEDILIFQRK